VGQSLGGAVFGFVFGLASLGTIALLLGLRRRIDLSRNRG
jgi:tetrahydromethanopterin S-methyltransferase subunit B